MACISITCRAHVRSRRSQVARKHVLVWQRCSCALPTCSCWMSRPIIWISPAWNGWKITFPPITVPSSWFRTTASSSIVPSRGCYRMKTMNIGIVAHVDTGKTSLTECVLYKTNVIDEIGRVDQGNTQTDSMELEKRRGLHSFTEGEGVFMAKP